ncbi:hypothetical protein CTRI78_v007981 [Colletotrichum trifolii]|uniref:Uncharacterized protein n=1 Tax=Colletotrichum trifolii TaxID=5466 RepID=A0A4R8R0N1_COLTR|nr:hypothetical protein CTRI78_v007981 [Colletotrichum trifolii]
MLDGVFCQPRDHGGCLVWQRYGSFEAAKFVSSDIVRITDSVFFGMTDPKCFSHVYLGNNRLDNDGDVVSETFLMTESASIFTRALPHAAYATFRALISHIREVDAPIRTVFLIHIGSQICFVRDRRPAATVIEKGQHPADVVQHHLQTLDSASQPTDCHIWVDLDCNQDRGKELFSRATSPSI